MSFKRYRIIFILIFMVFGSLGDQTPKHHMINDMENAQSDNKEGRALFPRAEYTNEWQPVGKGDPLKDPTYDYLPPVLDRVRYWADGTSQKNKNDVLVLGVPSKKLIKPNEKYNYGPIKRTYFSPPYQSHYSSPHQHYQQPQQQQHLPHRMMPPPKHVTDSYPMSTHHYQYNQHQHGWKTPNNGYTELRPENSINHVRMSRPFVTQPPPTTSTSMRHPSSMPFLPTIPPADRSKEAASASPTKPMSTQTTVKHNDPKTTVNGHMMPSKIENSHKDTTKPLLQSILQTETASPFTKKPSSVYQIEYTSNIYNPEAINSMATSSSNAATFVPTKPTLRPMPMKTTFKTSLEPSSSTTSSAVTTEQEEQKQHYVLPDMQAGWPVYNLIIEGHSKVKTYGLKNDDEIGSNMPKIRPVQAKENPIVERVTNSDDGPEFNVKHLKANKKDSGKFPKKTEDGKKSESAMTSLLSLLDSSFGNFLSDESVDKVRHESEKKIVKNEKENLERRKTRRSIPEDENNKQERVFGVSFQVDSAEANERPLNNYRQGTVITEKLWPFGTADISR